MENGLKRSQGTHKIRESGIPAVDGKRNSFYDKIQFNQMLEELCKFYLENATEIYKKVKYELKDRALQKKIYNDTKIIYKKYKKQIKFEKKQLIYTIGVFHPRIIRIYWLFVTIKNKIYTYIYCKIQHSFVRKQIHIYYCMKIAEIIFQTRSSFSVLRLDVFLQ